MRIPSPREFGSEQLPADGGDAGYRALFEHAADAVLVADDSGVYLDANPAARMFGVDRDELIGRRVADFVVDDPVGVGAALVDVHRLRR